MTSLSEFSKQSGIAKTTLYRRGKELGISFTKEGGLTADEKDRLANACGVSPAAAQGAITLRPTGGIDLPEVNPCPNVFGDYSHTTLVQEQAAQIQEVSTDRLQQFLSAYTQHRVLGAIAQIDAQVDAIQATAINAALGKLNGGGNAA